ncbi:hydrolase GDSL [Clostridium carboxidivorans P7]|uniref:Lipolytic protein G-D-S-L family n=1 Tax=Clostridium carboxidivorans P7 TaxID=536227 RepID=C6PUF9_9CLOT|nr:SGNH/GDSL hydrolase family protein [Clostridium carboxidivorans]AKN30542.1 hydrolase GDSL [Clostridium carboxidivorans P7]EET87157.1 lipolytic protein G-D-S-L family [Clostridium carboxidivorans P7]EFG86288.1 GDSL-like lipase/acylhydrolase [Clostridium carboxidivorans P7]
MKKQIRRLIILLVSIIVVLVFLGNCSKTNRYTHWIGTWNGSASDFTLYKLRYKNQTLCTIVTSTFGGSKERIKISNEFGTGPINIGEVSSAVVNSDGSASKSLKKTLTFGGKSTVDIDKGSFVWSDPFELDIKALDKVAVSIYVTNEVKNVTGACGGVESYFSKEGNFTDSVDTRNDFKAVYKNGALKVSPFFTSMEVMTSKENGSIIAFGDSITTLSWPDYLVKRLNDANIKNLSIIREAISGNRILHDSESTLHGLCGPSGISRFEKAVTDHQGGKYVIVLEGVNDIMHTGPGGPAPASEIVSKDEIIDGLKTYIEIAHKHNLKIYGATIMPFGGYEVYSPELDVKRKEVNEWIRTSGMFDGVIDFDKATLDPNNPTKLLPQYDSGDHIHPSDVGSEAMANMVDLKLFK